MGVFSLWTKHGDTACRICYNKRVMKNDDGSIPKRFMIWVIVAVIALFIALSFPTNSVSYSTPVEAKEVEQEEDEALEKTVQVEPKVKPKNKTILKYISHCESRDRQFEPDGSVLRNKSGSSAIGKYQIMESVWGEKAEELGYDLYTEEGNAQMAHYILTEGQGIGAWSASNECFSETFGFIISNNKIVWN